MLKASPLIQELKLKNDTLRKKEKYQISIIVDLITEERKEANEELYFIGTGEFA